MATYNIGKDASASITANGAPLNPLTLTRISYKQQASIIESQPLNAPPAFRKVMKGWEGDFTYDRGGSALDQFFAQEEAIFWAGGDTIPMVILLTIIDPVTRVPAQFRFDGVVMMFESGGEFEAEKPVSQKVMWRASTMTPVQ